MRNLFYDLPDEILHLIYRKYFRNYVLKEFIEEGFEKMGWYEEWNGYGIYGLSGEEANLYKHNFTIWNGYNFEWKSRDDNGYNLRQDWTDDYGTKENPIQCSYKVWKLFN